MKRDASPNKGEYNANVNGKYDQKINRTNSIAMTKDILVGLFVKKQFKKALTCFDNIVYNTHEVIRHERQNERKKRQRKP